MSTPRRFTDLAQAARELASRISGERAGRVDLVLALGDPALPVAEVVAAHLDLAVEVLPIDRGESPRVGEPPACADTTVMVVDRGVETGQSAWAAAEVLREAGVTRLILAVPVCPRQAESTLVRAYDEIVAVQRPLGRRSLQWHYETPLE